MRVAVVIAAALVLTACTAAPAATPTPEPASSVTSSLTCQQYGLAASVIVYATLGNAQGIVTDEKMASDLTQGKTMLDTIEVEPGTDLAAAVQALEPVTAEQLAAEAAEGPESEWDRRSAAVLALCDAAGDAVEYTMPGG